MLSVNALKNTSCKIWCTVLSVESAKKLHSLISSFTSQTLLNSFYLAQLTQWRDKYTEDAQLCSCPYLWSPRFLFKSFFVWMSPAKVPIVTNLRNLPTSTLSSWDGSINPLPFPVNLLRASGSFQAIMHYIWKFFVIQIVTKKEKYASHVILLQTLSLIFIVRRQNLFKGTVQRDFLDLQFFSSFKLVWVTDQWSMG